MKTLTAAIQFGSSRICAAAMMMSEGDQYEVIAIESTTSAGCIRHGNVASIEDTAVRVKTLMQKLSNRIKTKGFRGLDAAYVGICGISMHAIKHEPSEVLVGTPEATAEILESLRQKSLDFQPSGFDILGMEANGFRIEGQQVIGEHQLIVADVNLKKRYEQVMKRAGVRVAGFIASPLSLSDLATAEEREQGCVIINIGSALTSVAVYKDDSLKLLTVLPLGGDAVTNDIASKGLRIDQAEMAKTNWSDASNPTTVENAGMAIAAGMEITQEELNNIVTCRYEELAANVLNQIKLSGAESLDGGCIVTGGASLHRGLTTLLQKRLNISPVATRGCSSISYGQSERKPYLAELMSMLQSCTEDCETKANSYQYEESQTKGPQVIIRKSAKPRTNAVRKDTHEGGKKTGFFQNFIGDLFSGLDDGQ